MNNRRNEHPKVPPGLGITCNQNIIIESIPDLIFKKDEIGEGLSLPQEEMIDFTHMDLPLNRDYDESVHQDHRAPPSSSSSLKSNSRFEGYGGHGGKVFSGRRKNQEPVISCGIICFNHTIGDHVSPEELKIIFIRRKDSLSYVEFIRGKYRPSDPQYIRTLLRGMTRAEHEMILTKTFPELWEQMWIKTSKKHQADYEKSMSRFESCKGMVRRFIEENPSEWTEPEWGFPKGRPNRYESTVECALREFEEETGVKKEKVKIIDNLVYHERYRGTNGIEYCNKYLVGVYKEGDLHLDFENMVQMKEVSGVEWFTINEAKKRIRSIYPSRIHILDEVYETFLANME